MSERRRVTKKPRKYPDMSKRDISLMNLQKARAKGRVGGSSNMTSFSSKEIKGVASGMGMKLSVNGVRLTKGELERQMITKDPNIFLKSELRKKYGGSYDAGQGRKTRYRK